MNRSTLEAALGLSAPSSRASPTECGDNCGQLWKVTDDRFSFEEKRLDISIDFEAGSTFSCPECGAAGAKAYDTQQRTWRHLNFFQHETYLHARVPRVECPKGCGIKTVEVPWTRSGSGFTALFEALIMMMAREMPVAAIANLVGEHDTRIWRVLHHHVDEARAQADFSEVQRIGMDETASRRGHNYITFFFDLHVKRLLYGAEGRDQETVHAFAEDLRAHGGDPDRVRQACCDMWPAYISGLKTSFPNAEITFDRFHIMKIMNQAVDEVRRQEAKTNKVLKKTRYLWLKNPADLSAQQRGTMASLAGHNLKTARAYQIRLTLQELFTQPNREAGEAFLKRWYFWATHSRLEPIIQAAKTIKRHWDGVLNWFDSLATIGLLEGYNSLIQAAKARARGYRSDRNLIAMGYLIAGKLNFNLPT